MLLQSWFAAFSVSVISTPFIIKFAEKFGFVDHPGVRKIHGKKMPLLGGLAIFVGFVTGLVLLEHYYLLNKIHLSILTGSLIVVITGMLDDKYELSPLLKMTGQLLAAGVVIFYGNMLIESIDLPLHLQLSFGIFSIPITILWITGVTNAMNLIDGLDGLSAGVSAIALAAIAGMALIKEDHYVFTISSLLICAISGFLPYNFHPAKIFLGDTGSLFLGYMISVLALLGFKNITFISFIVPILILGVPLSDTLLAIIRRIVNRMPISRADRSHLHHRLLHLGFTHRQTVVLIYCMSALFALAAFIFSLTTVWGSIFLLCIIVLVLELLIEKTGLIHKKYKPLLRMIELWKFRRRIR